MRLDHLLSREYITTDQVQIEWREEFRLKFVESYIVFKVPGTDLERVKEWADHGGIAQLVEHLLCKQGVIGSNPFTSTNTVVGLRRDEGS